MMIRSTVARVAAVGALLVSLCGLVAIPAATADSRAPGEVSALANGTAVFNGNGINIRNRPFLQGTKINGKGYDGQQADLICATTGDPVNGIVTWYRLTNRATGVTGYVSYVYLRSVWWTNPVGCCRGSRCGGASTDAPPLTLSDHLRILDGSREDIHVDVSSGRRIST
jgi:hypothetical protein